MPRRARNEAVEEGRYSDAEEGVEDERAVGSEEVERDAEGCLKGKAFFVRDAVRERMAARCGAVLERASKSFEGDLFG